MDKQSTARWWLPLFVLALAVTAIPVLITPMPPLLDYPNHYVRLWLLEGGADLQPLARIYRIDWQGAYTNIFIDLVAAAAKGVVPVSIVGPGMLLLSLLLPGIGIAALANHVHGRLTWWHLLCVILGWGQVFLLGFVNFQISLGLALLGAVAVARMSQRGLASRSILNVIVGCVLLVTHPFGLLLYVLLIGGLAMGADWAPSGGWREALLGIRRAIEACIPLIVLVGLFWLLAPHPGDHQAGPPEATQWQSTWIIGKPAILLSPFKTYRAHADLLFVAAFVAPIVVAMLWRRLRWHGGLLVSALVLAIGSLVMPSHYLGTAFIDIRLPLMLWMTLAVALLPDVGRVGFRAAIGAIMAMAVVLVRAEGIGRIWLDRRGDLEAVDRVLARIPAGQIVLPLVQTPDHQHIRDLPLGRAVGDQVDFWHLATLAIVERHAFVPTLFANPGKQVVQVLPPYRMISVPEGAIASVDQLGRRPGAIGRHEFPYLAAWRCFDYILVTDADVANAAGAMPTIPQITLVEDAGFARLYAIRHGGCSIPGLGAPVRTVPN